MQPAGRDHRRFGSQCSEMSKRQKVATFFEKRQNVANTLPPRQNVANFWENWQFFVAVNKNHHFYNSQRR
jgi:hypothetical protein